MTAREVPPPGDNFDFCRISCILEKSPEAYPVQARGSRMKRLKLTLGSFQ